MRLLEAFRRRAGSGASRKPGRVYADMRRMALGLAHAEHRAHISPIGDNLVAVLVEMPVGKRHHSTVLCVADGTTSLYLSNGGGFIGAGELPAVRDRSRELLEIAANITRLDQARWARRGKRSRDTRFDFVTTEGVVTGWSDMDHRSEENAFLRIVYVCAQKVITEIRVSESETRSHRKA